MASILNDVLTLHRKQLRGLIELRGVKKLKPLYEQARADIEAKLAKLKKQGRGQSFTAHHQRYILAQVKDGLRAFDDKFQAHLEAQGNLAGTLGARHLVSSIKKLEKKFTGHAPVLQVEQAAVMRGIYKDTHPALLNRYKKSMAYYTKPVVEKVKQAMAQSMLTGEGVDEAIDAVAGADGVFDQQLWRAERIVRTELSYSYNVVQFRSMQEMKRVDLPDLKKTMISTFDGREGEDAEEQHMQIVDVDEPFVWHKKMKGGGTEVVHYMAPPSRPNDRAVMIPWRNDWSSTGIGKPGGVEPTTKGLPSVMGIAKTTALTTWK